MRGRLLRVARRLAGRPPVIYSVAGAPDSVALTFDDGPSTWTPEVAVALERHGCLGTFFILGEAVAETPEPAARLAAAGHELGSHLWSHSRPRAAERRRAARRDRAHRVGDRGGDRRPADAASARPTAAPRTRLHERPRAEGPTRSCCARSTRPTGASSPRTRSSIGCWRGCGPVTSSAFMTGSPAGSSGTSTRAADGRRRRPARSGSARARSAPGDGFAAARLDDRSSA